MCTLRENDDILKLYTDLVRSHIVYNVTLKQGRKFFRKIS